MQFLLNW